MLHLVRSRLSVRLTLLFLLGSVTPIVGAAVLGSIWIEQSVERDSLRRQRMLAGLCGALFEDYVDGAQEKLTTVARLVAQDERSSGRMFDNNRDYRDALVQRLGALVEPPDLFLELQYFAGGDEPSLVSQVRQRSFEEAQLASPGYHARNDAQVLSNMNTAVVQAPTLEGVDWRSSQLEEIEGYQTLSLSVTVDEPEGTRGALVAYLDFAELRSRFDAISGGDYGLTISDGAGAVLAHTGLAAGTIERSFELGEGGWSITLAEPEERLRQAASELRSRTLGWLVAAAVLALALGIGLSSWITRPVAELRRAAERMAGGDLTTRLEMDRPDEIGRLAQAFDRMASSLAQLDAAKSEFVSTVSHELRTPITSLRLSIANVLEGVLGDVDERQRPALERARREVDRMSNLVGELLEMARLEAGTVELVRERVALADVARDVASAVEPQARERDVAIEVTGEGEACGDRSVLRRVLTNLVDNAVKFSPPGGRVGVSVVPGEIRVADEGPGFADEGLFEAFRQGDQDGVKHPGVGLGLSIVRKLVELSGGSIRAESRPGEGALFVVKLPRGDA